MSDRIVATLISVGSDRCVTRERTKSVQEDDRTLGSLLEQLINVRRDTRDDDAIELTTYERSGFGRIP